MRLKSHDFGYVGVGRSANAKKLLDYFKEHFHTSIDVRACHTLPTPVSDYKYQLYLTLVTFDIHTLMQIKLEQVQRQVTKWILKTSNECVLKLQTSIKNIPYQFFLHSRHYDHKSH